MASDSLSKTCYRPSKRRLTACALAVFLGIFGMHKFYLGYYQAGFVLLGCTVLGGILTLGLGAGVSLVIGVIEGFVYFALDDDRFQEAYVENRREWF